jgi:hypothetical protein
MDGIDDLGLWNPDRATQIDTQAAEWYWLVSGVTTNDTPPGGGNLGPTIAGGAAAVPPNGRIVPDPITVGRNVVRFTPTPFGNDLYMQYGDEFALPIVGNFDPPATLPAFTPGTNMRDPLDVNNDGKITAFDALAIINDLNVNGIHPAPTGGFTGSPFLDVDENGMISAFDALQIINWLNLNPVFVPVGGGGGEAIDEVLSSSEPSHEDLVDAALLDILSREERRR